MHAIPVASARYGQTLLGVWLGLAASVICRARLRRQCRATYSFSVQITVQLLARARDSWRLAATAFFSLLGATCLLVVANVSVRLRKDFRVRRIAIAYRQPVKSRYAPF